MKKALLCVLFAAGSVSAFAADDEAALKQQMAKDCAPLFAAGGACADLATGTRNCVRQNLGKGGAACAAFEKANKPFFDAGKDHAATKKQP
jgi:hypothetical protein